MRKLKEFYNLLGIDTVLKLIKNHPAKVIQIAVFILLIIAFTFNHYRFTRPCVEWKKGINPLADISSPFADVFGDSQKEINICAKYGLLPDGIMAKSGHTRRIPADLIFLFVGVGIVYFTKDLKPK